MSRHRDVRNRTYSYDEVEVEVERRIASDGEAYTREEFVDYYGGIDQWMKAPPELAASVTKKKKKKKKKKKNKNSNANTNVNTGSDTSTPTSPAVDPQRNDNNNNNNNRKNNIGNNAKGKSPEEKLLEVTARTTQPDNSGSTNGNEFSTTIAATADGRTGHDLPPQSVLDVSD